MFGYVPRINADSAFGGSFKEWASEIQIKGEVPKTYTMKSKGEIFISFPDDG
jgi:hypothetical protein